MNLIVFSDSTFSLFKPACKSLFLKHLFLQMWMGQCFSALSCLGKAMGAASRCRFDFCSFHLLLCVHVLGLLCRSRARSRFVVDFSILSLSLSSSLSPSLSSLYRYISISLTFSLPFSLFLTVYYLLE